jgi:hypothetical protein
MMGQLITLPLRLSACTASFVLRSSEEVLNRVLSVTGRAVEAAELAAVNLYESAHRGRQTVLSAVERQLAARDNAPN